MYAIWVFLGSCYSGRRGYGSLNPRRHEAAGQKMHQSMAAGKDALMIGSQPADKRLFFFLRERECSAED